LISEEFKKEKEAEVKTDQLNEKMLRELRNRLIKRKVIPVKGGRNDRW